MIANKQKNFILLTTIACFLAGTFITIADLASSKVDEAVSQTPIPVALAADPVVNGQCGTANLTTISSAPSGGSLCASGSASSVTYTGSGWTWNCNGSGGGSESATVSGNGTIPSGPFNVTPDPVACGGTITMVWDSGGTGATSCIDHNASPIPLSGVRNYPAGTGPSTGAGVDCTNGSVDVYNHYELVSVNACPSPVIDISPSPLPFGDTQVFNTRSLDFTVRNTGGGILVVNTNPTITDGGSGFAPNYSCVSAACGSPQNISAGDSRTYTIEFTPDTVSNGQTATLNLSGTFSRTVDLTGNGVSAPAYCWEAGMSYFVMTDGECGAHGTRDGAGPAPSACDSAGEVGNEYRQGCYGGGPDTLYDYTCVDTCSAPPAPYAYFTTPSPVNINSNDPAVLNWGSSNADPGSCVITDVGNTVPYVVSGTSGTFTSPPLTSNTSFSIQCSNAYGVSPNSPDVTVNVLSIPPPVITLFSATPSTVDDGNSTDLVWNTANATACYGNGVGGFTNAVVLANGNTSGSVNIGPLSYTGSDYIFGLLCQGPGGWAPGPTSGDYEEITVTVNPPPAPTGNFLSGTGCTIAIGNSTCTTNDVFWEAFDTTGAFSVENTTTGAVISSTPNPSGPSTVTLQRGSNNIELLDGGSLTPPLVLNADCDTAVSNWDSGSGTCVALSNLVGSVPSESPSSTFDPNTGNYTFVSVDVFIENSGSPTPGSFDVIVDVDRDGPGPLAFSDPLTYTIAGLGAPDSNTRSPVIFNDIPFGDVADVRVRIDDYPGVGSVPESNETDNVSIEKIGDGVPNINMDLDLDPSDLVRGGGTVTIDYDTNASFPMRCTLSGPQLQPSNPHIFDPATDGPTNTLTAGPISTKSQYTLVCEVPNPADPNASNPSAGLIMPPIATFTDSASVETTGFVEEI